MADANPSPAFAAPGNPDKSLFGGDTSSPEPARFAAPQNGGFSGLPSAAGDPMGDPRCVPHAPTPDQVKSMFRGAD